MTFLIFLEVEVRELELDPVVTPICGMPSGTR